MSGRERWRLARPHLEWLGLLGAAGLVFVGGAWLVARLAGVGAVRGWLLPTAVGILYVLGITAASRDAADEAAPTSIGIATGITLGRGLLYAAVAGFLLVPPTEPLLRWLPGLAYGLGASLDFVDGRLARGRGRETAMGARLDLAFDTMGFLVASLVGVVWGRLPIVYLALGAARYVFRGGRWWRRRRGRPIGELPESQLRRYLAAGQMGVITVALLPVLPTSVVHPVATVAVLPSLAMFGRDWLAVSGRLPGHEA